MIYRSVLKSEAATAEIACEVIRLETGGQVQHAQGFEVIDGGDHWRVPVWSGDGKPSTMPLPHGAVFPRTNCLSEKEIQKQIDLFAGGEELGWTPGEATGPGFNKQ